MNTNILKSLTIIGITLAAVVYGWLMFSKSSPICWQKYPDRPCQTTGEILKEELFKNL